jgi:hypothetical protein
VWFAGEAKEAWLVVERIVLRRVIYLVRDEKEICLERGIGVGRYDDIGIGDGIRIMHSDRNNLVNMISHDLSYRDVS